MAGAELDGDSEGCSWLHRVAGDALCSGPVDHPHSSDWGQAWESSSLTWGPGRPACPQSYSHQPPAYLLGTAWYFAVRFLSLTGAITRDRLEAVRESDAILREEFANNGLAGKVWQYFTIVPDVKSTGIIDGKRSWDWPVIIRP